MAAVAELPVTERSAVALAAAIRARELSAADVVEAHIARHVAFGRAVNAVVADRFEAARSEARAADELVAERGCRSAAPVGRAVHGQGVDRTGRDAERRRVGRARRLPGARKRAGRAAADGRGRDPARGHEHVRADTVDRIGEPPVRAHVEPVRPLARGRGVVGGRGRRGRFGRLAVRRGRRRRRLDQDPRAVLRRVRTQAVVGRDPQHRSCTRRPPGTPAGCSSPGRSPAVRRT